MTSFKAAFSGLALLGALFVYSMCFAGTGGPTGGGGSSAGPHLWLSSASYGTTGNGSDQTTAMSAAFTACQNNVMYFPPGTYEFNSAIAHIPSECTIQGAGEGVTIFEPVGTWASTAFMMQVANGGANDTLQDFTFDVANTLTITGGTTVAAAIFGFQLQNAIFRRVQIIDNATPILTVGMGCDGCNRPTWEYDDIEGIGSGVNNGGAGILAQSVTHNTSFVKMSHNFYNGAGNVDFGNGLYCQASTGSGTNSLTDCDIDNNTVLNWGDTGIECSTLSASAPSSGCHLSNNFLKQTAAGRGKAGEIIGSVSNSTLQGGAILMCGFSGGGEPVMLYVTATDGNAANISVSNVVLNHECDSGSTSGDEVYLQSGDSSDVLSSVNLTGLEILSSGSRVTAAKISQFTTAVSTDAAFYSSISSTSTYNILRPVLPLPALQGGTGSQVGVDLNTTASTMSSADVTITPAADGNMLQILAVTGSHNLVIKAGTFLGQVVVVKSCQDASHTPTFVGDTGVTLEWSGGSAPTPTASKCDLYGFIYTDTSNKYWSETGFTSGENN